MKLNRIILILSLLLSFTALAAVASDEEIAGVFGLDPMPENTAVAVWVPLNGGESISGVMWYNNDGSLAIPEILAVAGNADYPSVLNQALSVGEAVSGNTLDWSELSFPTPLASASTGLFLVFKLPADGAFVSEGDGFGLGYQLGDGRVRCWISTEEGEWDQLSPDYQMAVLPVMNSNKSGEVILLEFGENTDQQEAEKPLPVSMVSGLVVFPNPFNPQTEISFSLPSGRDVELTIYDLRGRKVSTLMSGFLATGAHSIKWDGRDSKGQTQASGVYFCKLSAGSIQLTGRLALIR